MKKSLIALSVISAYPLTFTTSAHSAATTSVDKNQTETIVVTANRTTQDKFDVLAAVNIFSRDDIEQIQPLSVADLLTRVAGITVATQGTQANATSLYVRGGNSDHVLILVNGVRIGSATLGVKDIATIPVQLIERIEIVRGARAALWGSDAIGGVIQIFTRQLESGEAQVGASYGTHNYKQGYGAIALGNKNNHYTLSANAESSNGFDVLKPAEGSYSVDQRDRDGYNSQSVSLTGNSEVNNRYSIEVNAQYDQGTTEFDANHLYSGDKSDYENYQLLIRNHLQLNNYYLQASLASSQDSSEDNFAQFGALENSLFQTRRNQASALIQIPIVTTVLNNSEVIAGFDWYKEELKSNLLFSQLSRKANAFYVTARQQLSSLKLEGSLRRDAVGNISAKTTYQLSAGYQIADNTLIVFTRGTAFKAPTFNDLYWPADAFFQGNKNLKHETATNTELLARYQGDTYSAEFSLYNTSFDNLIVNGAADGNDPWGLWTTNNVESATIKGAEATLSATFNALSHHLTLSHVDAQNDNTKEQLLRRPYFSANYNIAYQLNNWNIAIDVNHQGSRYDNFNFTRTKLASYTLVSLGVNYQATKQLMLYAKITNMGNKKYQHIPEYQGDERNLKLAFEYNF